MKREDFDILPPEPLCHAEEYLFGLVAGSRRYDLYELTSGGTWRGSKRMLVNRGLIKNERAFEDLIDLNEFLDTLGRHIVNGSNWRKLIDWETLKKKGEQNY